MTIGIYLKLEYELVRFCIDLFRNLVKQKADKIYINLYHFEPSLDFG